MERGEVTARCNRHRLDGKRCAWPAGHPPHPQCHTFTRASHLCVCDTCGKLYIEHPYEPSIQSGIDGRPFLQKLCDGSLVKL